MNPDKEPKERMVVQTIKLSPRLRALLRRAAHRAGCAPADLVRTMLERSEPYLEHLAEGRAQSHEERLRGHLFFIDE